MMQVSQPPQRKTLEYGNWSITITLPQEGETVPSVRLEDKTRADKIALRAKKSSQHAKICVASSIELSNGSFVNADNCVTLYATLYTQLEEEKQKAGETFHDGEERELSDKEKDVKKCMLAVATNLIKILANKFDRREMLEVLPKGALIELAKSDWLTLEKEEDWFKFCKAWAKLRAKKTLIERGVPIEEKKPVIPVVEKAQKKEKGKEKENKEEDSSDKAKTEADTLSDTEEDDGYDEEERALEKEFKAETKRLRKQWKKKGRPAWQKTPEYRELMNKHLKGVLEHIRFANMSLRSLAFLHREPFDFPPAVLAMAYRFHLYREEKFIRKAIPHKEAYRLRRYHVLEWDRQRRSPGLTISKERDAVTTNSNCCYKSILAKKGYSSGRHRWEIVVSSEPTCSTAVGVATRNFSVGSLLGMDDNSWAWRLNANSYCSTGPKRKSGVSCRKGDIVTCELDMDKGTFAVFYNSKLQAHWTGLKGKTLYPAMNICHQDDQKSKGFLLRRA